MIFGECPYEDCDEPFNVVPPDHLPTFGKMICEKCKRHFWEYMSRIDAHAYTLEQFGEKYDVDESIRRITLKKDFF